jgi:hypothetical protein
MGILGEGRSAVAEIESSQREAFADARTGALSAIMGNLSATLSKPVFEGDVETALVHYMGEEAFEDEVATRRYTELAARIAAQPDERVPVLFIHQDHDQDGDPIGGVETTMLIVSRENLRFKSETTVEKAVKMHALTSKTADVTHKRLSIQAGTMTFDGDLLNTNSRLSETPETGIEFALSESHVADDERGGGMPSDFAFSDYGMERFYGNPTVLVGWNEIEAAVIKGLASQGNGPQGAIRLKEFFAATGQIPVLKEGAPLISMLVEAAGNMHTALGNVGIKAI